MSENPNPKTYLKELEKSGIGKLLKLDVEKLDDGDLRVACKFTTSDSGKAYFGDGTALSEYSAELSACEDIVKQLKNDSSGNSSKESNKSDNLPTQMQESVSTSAESEQLNPSLVDVLDNGDIFKNAFDQIFYCVERVLGKTATSQVFLGFFEVPEKKIAVKRCAIEDMEIKEVTLLRTFDPSILNIVHYYGAKQKGNYWFIALELAECSLEDLMTKPDKRQHRSELTEENLKSIASGAANGLAFLHDKAQSIIHRDMKPANVLIFPGYVAKLTDFGISRKVASITMGTVTSPDKGTLAFLPKEALQPAKSFHLTYSFDMFGLGIVIFFAVSRGNHLFANYDSLNILEIIENIKNNKPNWKWVDSYRQFALKDLVESLVSPDPEARPRASEVIKHPLFWDDTKFLQFIMDIRKDPRLNNEKSKVRIKLDKMYADSCEELDISDDWKARLHPELRGFCLQQDNLRKPYVEKNKPWPPNLKPYYRVNIMRLIEFIRDHHEHANDMNKYEKGILNRNEEIFGKDRRNYGNYFMQTFPELATLIYKCCA